MLLLPLRSQQFQFFRERAVQKDVSPESEGVSVTTRVSEEKIHAKKLKTKRGKRASKKQKSSKNNKCVKLEIIGANAAGLFNKKESLIRLVDLFKPAVLFIQETKARTKNKIRIENYLCFEAVRSDTGGGGLLTAVHKALSPIQVSLCDEAEILVVEAKFKDRRLRLIN